MRGLKIMGWMVCLGSVFSVCPVPAFAAMAQGREEPAELIDCSEIQVSDVIGPNGGSISVAAATLVVPPGALEADTLIRLVRTPRYPEADVCDIRDIYTAEPFGLHTAPLDISRSLPTFNPFVLYWKVKLGAAGALCPAVSWTSDPRRRDCFSLAYAGEERRRDGPCLDLSGGASIRVPLFSDRLGHFRLFWDEFTDEDPRPPRPLSRCGRFSVAECDCGRSPMAEEMYQRTKQPAPTGCVPVPYAYRRPISGPSDIFERMVGPTGDIDWIRFDTGYYAWAPACLHDSDCSDDEYCNGPLLDINDSFGMARDILGVKTLVGERRVVVRVRDWEFPTVSVDGYDLPVAHCPGGGRWGSCVKRPSSCEDSAFGPFSTSGPVCGCDGRMYERMCDAEMAGVTIHSRNQAHCGAGDGSGDSGRSEVGGGQAPRDAREATREAVPE